MWMWVAIISFILLAGVTAGLIYFATKHNACRLRQIEASGEGRTSQETDGSFNTHRVLWVQQVFIPLRHHIHVAVDVVNSVLAHLDEYERPGFHVDMVCGGWALSDEIWDTFQDQIDLKRVHLRRFEFNYGLGYMYNQMIKPRWEDYDIIITNQSDLIVIKEQPYVLERLAQCFNHVPRVGKISFNLTKESYHVIDPRWEVYNVYHPLPEHNDRFGVTVLLQAPTKGGVAGSTSVFSSKALREVGGFCEAGVYAPEDAWMQADLHNKGYKVMVAQNAHVIDETYKVVNGHPYEARLMAWRNHSIHLATENPDRHLQVDQLEHLAQQSADIFHEWDRDPLGHTYIMCHRCKDGYPQACVEE